MLILTVGHLRKVLTRFYYRYDKTGLRYLIVDTETKAKEGYESKDALTYGRMDITFISICYEGASYAMPTCHFNPDYPSPEEWGEALRPIFEDTTVTKVSHNSNYDLNVLFTSGKVAVIKPFFCTAIGCWKSAEYLPKGLKDRVTALGRMMRQTSTVDFTSLKDAGDYAEEDVVGTEELFLLKTVGPFKRPRTITYVRSDGSFKLADNPHYTDEKISVPSEELADIDKLWLKYVEFPVLSSVIRAERRGFPFDAKAFLKCRADGNAALRDILKRLYKMAGGPVNLRSSKVLEEVCARLKIENPFVTKTKKAAFHKKAIKTLSNAHPFFALFAEYKAVQVLVGNYLGSKSLDLENPDYKRDKKKVGMEYFVSRETGHIHCTLNTVGAVTGRSSCERPNMQQIPSKADRFGIKSCFSGAPVPFPGITFVRRYPKRHLIILDYAQLELRVMALLSKDPLFVKVLSDPDGDLHNTTSAEFGVTRDESKQLNFLLIYGGEAYMLSQQLTFSGIPTSESKAKTYVQRHKEVYPGVVGYRKMLLDHHQRKGFVWYFCGRRRHLPDIDWTNKRSIHSAETTLANNTVQGSGQDFLKAAIIRSDPNCINVDKAVLTHWPEKLTRSHRLYLADKAEKIVKYRKILKLADAKFRLQVHDEAAFTVVPEAAEECLGILADIMSWRHYVPALPQYDYNVPLLAEGGVGENWKDAKSKDKYIFHLKAGFEDWAKFKN